MRTPFLVLQYPDPEEGRTVAVAATRSPRAFQSFKEAVIEEASLKALGWGQDEVLDLEARLEFERLEKVLALLIPEGDQDAE